MGIEKDLSGMEADIRRVTPENGARPISEYAPRRAQPLASDEPERTAVPDQVSLSTPALSKEIEDTAFRFSRMVANLQESERRAREELASANARIEQYDSRVSDLLSQLETERLNVIEANRRTEMERAEQVRLTTLFETIGGNVADALHGRKPQ